MGRGNDPVVWDSLNTLTPKPDIWLLHLNQKSGADKNPPLDFVANTQAPDNMNALKITVEKNGTFTITNTRNGFSKTYRK